MNAWTPDYGKIKIYDTDANTLVETGIVVEPDTHWHQFELIVNMETQKYISIFIDGEIKDLKTHHLAQVEHKDWGEDVSLSITTESQAAWPQENCSNIFSWKTHFRDVTFGYPRTVPPITTELLFPVNASQNLQLSLTLSWKYSERASSYDLELWNENDTTRETVSDSFYNVCELDSSTQYYWRVRGRNRLTATIQVYQKLSGQQKGNLGGAKRNLVNFVRCSSCAISLPT